MQVISKIIKSFLSVIILGFLIISGCASTPRDLGLVGKWESTGIRMNSWEKGTVAPGDARIFRLHEDGTGMHINDDDEDHFVWKNSDNQLEFISSAGKEVYDYALRGKELSLRDNNNETIIYSHRP